MRHLVVPRTLCFVFDGNEVLLMRRSLHKRLFPGKVNGLGGHIEAGEDPAASAAREIGEEAGIEVRELWLAGVMHVNGGAGQSEHLPDGARPGVLVLVYTAQALSRAVRASEEGELMWVPLAAVEGFDWVDGDARVLRWALAARAQGAPFSVQV